jgi:TPR repeat protein
VKNEAEAAEHYELAVDHNYASAQFHYAVCLAQGRSVPKNQIEAAQYYKLATD